MMRALRRGAAKNITSAPRARDASPLCAAARGALLPICQQRPPTLPPRAKICRALFDARQLFRRTARSALNVIRSTRRRHMPRAAYAANIRRSA